MAIRRDAHNTKLAAFFKKIGMGDVADRCHGCGVLLPRSLSGRLSKRFQSQDKTWRSFEAGIVKWLGKDHFDLPDGPIAESDDETKRAVLRQFRLRKCSCCENLFCRACRNDDGTTAICNACIAAASSGTADEKASQDETLSQVYAALGLSGEHLGHCGSCNLLLPCNEAASEELVAKALVTAKSGGLETAAGKAFRRLVRELTARMDKRGVMSLADAQADGNAQEGIQRFLGQFLLAPCPQCEAIVCPSCFGLRTDRPACPLCQTPIGDVSALHGDAPPLQAIADVDEPNAKDIEDVADSAICQAEDPSAASAVDSLPIEPAADDPLPEIQETSVNNRVAADTFAESDEMPADAESPAHKGSVSEANAATETDAEAAQLPVDESPSHAANAEAPQEEAIDVDPVGEPDVEDEATVETPEAAAPPDVVPAGQPAEELAAEDSQVEMVDDQTDEQGSAEANALGVDEVEIVEDLAESETIVVGDPPAPAANVKPQEESSRQLDEVEKGDMSEPTPTTEGEMVPQTEDVAAAVRNFLATHADQLERLAAEVTYPAPTQDQAERGQDTSLPTTTSFQEETGPNESSWVACSHCGQRIKQRNLAKHERKCAEKRAKAQTKPEDVPVGELAVVVPDALQQHLSYQPLGEDVASADVEVREVARLRAEGKGTLEFDLHNGVLVFAKGLSDSIAWRLGSWEQQPYELPRPDFPGDQPFVDRVRLAFSLTGKRRSLGLEHRLTEEEKKKISGTTLGAMMSLMGGPTIHLFSDADSDIVFGSVTVNMGGEVNIVSTAKERHFGFRFAYILEVFDPPDAPALVEPCFKTRIEGMTDACFSPDESFLVVAVDKHGAYGKKPGGVKIFDTRTWKEVWTADINVNKGIALLPAGGLIALNTIDDSTLEVVNITTGEVLHRWSPEGLGELHKWCWQFSAGLEVVAVTSPNDGNVVALWSPLTGREIARFAAPWKRTARIVHLSADAHYLAVEESDGPNICVYEILTNESQKQAQNSREAPSEIPYFECDVPTGDGLCSDNACPCPEVAIPRGTGFLYIDQDLLNFRKQYPRLADARAAKQAELAQAHAELGDVLGLINSAASITFRLGPILVCEQGAKLRGLDLKVAAADAAHWWRTGQVPLRTTPTASESASTLEHDDAESDSGTDIESSVENVEKKAEVDDAASDAPVADATERRQALSQIAAQIEAIGAPSSDQARSLESQDGDQPRSDDAESDESGPAATDSDSTGDKASQISRAEEQQRSDASKQPLSPDRINEGMRATCNLAGIEHIDHCAICQTLLPTDLEEILERWLERRAFFGKFLNIVERVIGDEHLNVDNIADVSDLENVAIFFEQIILMRCNKCEKIVCVACRNSSDGDVLCKDCQTQEAERPEKPAREKSAESLEAATEPAPPQVIDKFDATNDVGDIYRFVAGHAQEELAELCRKYPLDNIDLTTEDTKQLHRLDRVTHLATILAGYPKVLETHPDLGLSPALDHAQLAAILFPRLTQYLEALRDQPSLNENQPLAAAACKRLYDFGKDLMVHDREREAIVCFEVHAQVPMPDHEGDFWLACCWFNMANETKDANTIQKAMQTVQQLQTGTVTPQQQPAVQQMLTRLESIAEQAGSELKEESEPQADAVDPPKSHDRFTCPDCGAKLKKRNIERHRRKCPATQEKHVSGQSETRKATNVSPPPSDPTPTESPSEKMASEPSSPTRETSSGDSAYFLVGLAAANAMILRDFYMRTDQQQKANNLDGIMQNLCDASNALRNGTDSDGRPIRRAEVGMGLQSMLDYMNRHAIWYQLEANSDSSSLKSLSELREKIERAARACMN